MSSEFVFDADRREGAGGDGRPTPEAGGDARATAHGLEARATSEAGGDTRTTSPGGDARPTSTSELRTVIAMVVPVVITTSSRAMMDVADYIMVSNLGGKAAEAAQAAILPSQMLVFAYTVIGMGVVSVVTTFASQALGRGEPRRCGSYAWQSIYLSGFFGVMALAVTPVLEWVIAWIGHEPAVQRMEFAYGRIMLWCAGPTIAAAALGNFFVGVHRPWITVWSTLEANVLNVLLGLTLMFGWFGLTPMGMEGAAWGTFAANVYRMLRLLLGMLAPGMHAQFATRSTWRPSMAQLRDLVRVGMPCGIHWVSEVTVWALFVNLLIGRRFGTQELVATNTAWQYMRIAFMPAVGVGTALASLVGKSIGAGRPEQAERQAWSAVKITLAYMGTLSLVYWLAGPWLIGLFSAEPEVIRIGAQVMICAAVFQLFDALAINYSSALRGAGDTFWPTVFFIASSWSMILGGGYAMVTFFPQLGSVGPWIASSALIIATALFLWWRWHGGAWKKIELFGNVETSAK